MNGRLLIIKPDYDSWPMGFAYVLACLESHGIPFDFVDASRSDDWKEDVARLLESNRYVAAASGGLIGFYAFFKEVRDLVKRCQPRLPFVLGGNITRDASDRLLFGHIGADYGLQGEAEKTLPALVGALARGEGGLGALPGLVSRDPSGHVIRNPVDRLDLKARNLLPAWHHFDVAFYVDRSCCAYIGSHLRFMPVLTGRGCVGHCSFCSPSLGGFRKRPIEHVLEEIRFLSSRYDFDRILFYNEMFYPTRAEIAEFCSRYKKSEVGKPWIASVRMDAGLDEGALRQMKDAGCISVSAGFESGSDKVLKLMNKRSSSSQVRSFFRSCRAAGLPACGAFIVGNEGEAEEDLKASVDLAIEEEINSGESLLYVYPGTAVYERAVKKGLIRDELEHLERATQTYTGLFLPRLRDTYLNVSEIPDDRFLDVATREVRRYNTFLLGRYPVGRLACALEFGDNDGFVNLRGTCHECGAPVEDRYPLFFDDRYQGLLGQVVAEQSVCPACVSRLAFNIYSSEGLGGMADHASVLRERLRSASTVLVGIGRDALTLLRVDLLGMNYDKLEGIVDVTGSYESRFFVNCPVLRPDDLGRVNPDCLLMLDVRPEAEAFIRRAFKGVRMPDLLYLVDGNLRQRLQAIRRQARRRLAYYGFTGALRNGLRRITRRREGAASPSGAPGRRPIGEETP